MRQTWRFAKVVAVFLATSAVTVAVLYLVVAPAQDLRTPGDWRGFRALAGGVALVLSFIITGLFVTKWESRRIDTGQADDDLRSDIENASHHGPWVPLPR